MKVRLESDFRDFYDIWFDRDADCTLKRITTSGLSRGAMLNFLKDSGINTVKYGTCEELYNSGVKDVIVYLDTHTHRGEGKERMSAINAFMSMPNYLCSEYHGIEEGVSIRHLQLGEFWFKLKYKSADDLRSNCGTDVDISMVDTGFGYHKKIIAPIFAIDYVYGKAKAGEIIDKECIEGDKVLLAVDYNIAPGCGWTGVEDIVKPKDIADSIKLTIERSLKGEFKRSKGG